jgi:hypothetical protein
MLGERSFQRFRKGAGCFNFSVDSLRQALRGDLRQLIEAVREQTARGVNSTLVTMYWQIGERIRNDVLQNQRTEYGIEIVQTLSTQLSWSHFVVILSIEDSLKRAVYAELCRVER